MAPMILAGDIGGTKTLVALFDAGAPCFEHRYPSHDFASFDDLLESALVAATAELGTRPGIDRACFGVAGPVIGNQVHVTNLPWALDAAALSRRFSIGRIKLINDFAANAEGIEALAPQDVATLQAGAPVEDAPRVLIGAGTGLGVAYLIHDGIAHRVVASEGGHAGFAPADAAQAALWRFLHERLGRVEAEHVVSGSGLERIYAFVRNTTTLAAARKLDQEMRCGDARAAIARFALELGDPLANAALDLFVSCFGTVAGDHALNVVARGGVYVAGGIAPKILARLAAGAFVAGFNDKGAFSDLARSIPVRIVTNERLGLLGATRVASLL